MERVHDHDLTAAAPLNRRHQSLHPVHAQHRGVLRGRLQSADRFLDHGRGERFQFLARLAGHPFGQRGAGRDRRRAPSRLKARFYDAVAFESHPQPKHVAAGGIRNVYFDRRRREFSRIPRILEMVDQPRAVHSCFNYR